MTDVNKSKTRKINSIEDALSLYAPPPADFTGKIGLEVEMPLYRRGLAKPEIPTAAAMEDMQKVLKEKGYDAQLEAAGVLEYASRPYELNDVTRLIRDAETEVQDFVDVAASYGFNRAPFCVLPTTTRQDALDNMVSRERLQSSLTAMRGIFDNATLDIPLLTTGVQTSFSPKNADEMLEMMYRAYALTPLLTAALNSSAGFTANEPERKDYHFRTASYELYNTAGGIAGSFLNSSTGEELIRNHIDAVFKTPMHFAFDEQGKAILSTKDNIITFEKLVEMGLNTQTNYELAETFIYNDVKICNLRDVEGNVVGKRLEVRPADSGEHQAASTVLLTAALVPGGKTADAFVELLKEYGFTGSPKADADLLVASRDAATYHNGNFMNVPFGRGSLRDFAADVAGLLVSHYDGQDVGPELSRLTQILLTGECDAKVYAQKMPTLQDVTNMLQASAEPAVKTQPGLAQKNAR